jgi:hypothetical protein
MSQHDYPRSELSRPGSGELSRQMPPPGPAAPCFPLTLSIHKNQNNYTLIGCKGGEAMHRGSTTRRK